MGPTFAETTVRRRSFAVMIGLMAASVVALVALRPAPPAPPTKARMQFQQFNQYKHYKPVKRCIDGRWVIANDRARQ